MSRTVLVVEDDRDTRDRYVAALKTAGWNATEAINGELGLDCLRGSSGGFDIVLLDHSLGGITGIQMLEAAIRDGIPLPPVIVLSARLEPDIIRRYLELKVRALIPKPASAGVLASVLDSFSDPRRSAPYTLPGIAEHQPLDLCAFDYQGTRMHLYLRQSDTQARHVPGAQFYEKRELRLSEAVERRERALRDYFECRAKHPPRLTPREPLLVVARRWNSWYPSFFHVKGGAYAVLGVPAEGNRIPGVLIDPGFRALDVLGSLGVPVSCLDTCIVTHNHPDHVGGVFEYLASRHVLGGATRIHCAKPVVRMLESYAGEGLGPKEFNELHFDIEVPYRTAGGEERALRATPLDTSHQSAGPGEGTRGIIISSTGTNGAHRRDSTAVLLGDTEYDPDRDRPNSQLFEGMLRALTRPDVTVGVLHIGSCQIRRQHSGKHLYLAGLRDLLTDIEYVRSRHPTMYSRKLLVLVSEWGLEHATRRQVLAALPDEPTNDLKEAFDEESLVVETILTLQERYQTVTLLPADVGLLVGIETGEVYLDPEKPPVSPEKVGFKSDGEGLRYFEKS
ncbi:MAG: response regulator [Acidobacteria bacterium]|nr:response regulator [Acidobacteriota bacterium]